ncbi:MAG TPA: DUF4352 domain-containing protein [Microbacterium sp.]|nr:DUF4352 domain-containing protein [Microbacterium sp.]
MSALTPLRPAFATAAAALLLAVALTGCGTSATASGSSSGSAASDAPAEEPTTPGLNVPVTVGSFEFTALSAADIGTTIGTSPLSQTAQGTYFQVDLSVANIGDSAQTFLVNYVTLKDAAGRTYDADPTAGIYLSTAADTWVSSINPGNSVQGPVVFDLPAGTVPTELIVTDSLIGNGTSINLG